MPVRIVQTADPFRYKRMLEATSRTVIEFARRHGHAYEAYIGIKRGTQPAHAAFNRMYLLRDIHADGYRGWVLYLDADAYVWDMDFDLDRYLADKQDRSAVMATIDGDPVPWHINSGVLFFNMAHPLARRLIDLWMARFLALGDDELAAITSVWDTFNDQITLCQTLDINEDLRDSVFYEQMIRINHKSGEFIRQFYGSWEPDLETRIAKVAAEVEDAFANDASGRAA